jgi:endo-1,4-beta-xylanase
MGSKSFPVLGVAAGILSLGWLGCTDQQPADVQNTGTGGTVETGGTSGTGGIAASGGKSGSGGSVGSGGDTGPAASGGKPGSGGAPGSGGVAADGGSSTADAGGMGRLDGGRNPDSSGRPDSASSGSGGAAGAGGSAGTGGGPGAGGSTGPVTLPAKFVGNIDTRSQIRSDFPKYWNQFTPENAGKWGSVQGGGQASFSWNTLDTFYKYCNDNNIIFKQHTFVWGSQQPGWTDSLTTSNGPAAVQNWMKNFCERYPKTQIIDVVNEPPPHTTPKYANAIGGGTNSTWDWIANAFKWAREACPNAVLVLNDYNNDELSGDAQHTIDIVKAIKKLGAPIDAVGCQTHGATNAPASQLKTNIDKIASGTGLPVYITEYDINQADDTKQQQQYKDHFTMFMSNENIKGVTVWGYLVGATWVKDSGILKTDGTMRPAMTWLMDFLKR